MATRAAAQACGAYDPVTGFVECKSDAATVTAIESAGGVAYAGGGTLGLLTVKLKDGLLFTVPGVGVATAGVASSVVLLSGGVKIVAGAIGVENISAVGIASTSMSSGSVLVATGGGILTQTLAGLASINVSSGSTVNAGGIALAADAAGGAASVAVSSGSFITAGGIGIHAFASGNSSVSVSSGSFVTAAGIGIEADGVGIVEVKNDGQVSAVGIGIDVHSVGDVIIKTGETGTIDVARLAVDPIGVNVGASGNTLIAVSGKIQSVAGVNGNGGHGVVSENTGGSGSSHEIKVTSIEADQDGIRATTTSGASTSISVGSINAGRDAINVNANSGSVSVKVASTVEAGQNAVDVNATSSDVSLTIENVGKLVASSDAALINTTGKVTINQEGSITSTNGSAINVASAGDASLTLKAALSAGAYGANVSASGTVSVDQSSVAPITAVQDGLYINTVGKVTINQEGNITSTNGSAINVASAGDASLTLEAALSAGVDGVNVSGSGAVSVDQSVLAPITAVRDGLKAGSSGGAVTITQNSALTVGRDAIVVTGTGGTNMSTVTSNVAIVAPRNAILATNVNGPLTINANKFLTAATGIDVSGSNAAGAVTMNINAALNALTTGVHTDTVAASMLNIAPAASIAVASDLAVEAVNGPIRINNNGIVTGFVRLSPGDDTFDNNSSLSWYTHSAGTAGSISAFGAGVDTLNNTGRIVAARNANIAETVQFTGLENFNNGDPTRSGAGLTTLMDGAVNDVLITSGTFNGVGNSTLALDAFLGPPGSTADHLVVGTATSGATAIVINNTNPGPGSYNPVGIEVVNVSAGSTAAEHFYLAQGRIDRGMFFYDLLLRPDNIHVLAGLPDQEVFETPRIVTAAQEIWHQTAGVWLDRQSDLRMQLRGNLGQGVGSGLWTQMIGNWSKRKVTQEFSLYNGNYSFDVGYQQQVYGFMSGIDFGREALFGPDDAWLAGMLGGYIGSRVDFTATDTAAKYQGGTTGVYVTYLNQAYFIDALIKADFLSLDYAAPSLQPFGSNADAQARSIGARIDSGFRVPFAATSFIEPLATVSYVSTDIGDMALGGANVVYGDNDSLRARLGLRTGSQMWRRPGFRAEASLTASVWQEFLAKNGVQIVSAGPDLITTDSFNKTFFEVSGAVDFIDLGGGFSGHVKGDFRFADGGQFWSGKVNSGVRYRW